MPGAQRQLICRGDEAVVSRLRRCADPALEGLVERRQPVAPLNQKLIQKTVHIQGIRHILAPNREAYHALLYYAVRIAHLLYPENFVHFRAWRMSRIGRTTHSLIYSDFVPDGNGRIERMGQQARAFYAARDRSGDETERIRLRADQEEHRLNPNLPFFKETLACKGIILNHPEANYHLHDGKTVFFEVDGIDFTKLAQLLDEVQHRILPDVIRLYLALVAWQCEILQEPGALDRNAILRRNAQELADGFRSGGLEEFARFVEQDEQRKNIPIRAIPPPDIFILNPRYW